MTTTTALKSVTKAVLSGFVRENTTLNLTQSKALTEQLLAEYSITARPPADPDGIPVETGQMWLHAATGRTVRVTNVELGPRYVPNDPVTSWGPESVAWQDAADPTATGAVKITTWRQYMSPVGAPDPTENPEESSDQP
ncbi:UNVERIFIED_ORG: hypothetical protein ABIB52_000736 [Arthrobacter sp. UYCu721]